MVVQYTVRRRCCSQNVSSHTCANSHIDPFTSLFPRLSHGDIAALLCQGPDEAVMVFTCAVESVCSLHQVFLQTKMMTRYTA